MKFHVFKKEFCPAKDSVCRDCQNKGHWAKSVMCPKFSKLADDRVDPDKKVTDEIPKLGVTTKPTLKVISADYELPVSSEVSVKAITIPSVGKHYYTDFILGNHSWKQKCIIDPAPTLTVLVMIGLPNFTPLSGHTILNVVQSRLLEVTTWTLKLEFSLRFLGPQKIPPFLLISGSILFMVKMVLSLVPQPVKHLV